MGAHMSPHMPKLAFLGAKLYKLSFSKVFIFLLWYLLRRYSISMTCPLQVQGSGIQMWHIRGIQRLRHRPKLSQMTFSSRKLCKMACLEALISFVQCYLSLILPLQPFGNYSGQKWAQIEWKRWVPLNKPICIVFFFKCHWEQFWAHVVASVCPICATSV